jgi:hypothetical protein
LFRHADDDEVLEREALVANIITGNKKKVCQERGIPLDVFIVLWDDYRETHMFNGRFFHRLEIPIKNVHESAKRMRLAIEEYYANGNNVRTKGLRKSITGRH